MPPITASRRSAGVSTSSVDSVVGHASPFGVLYRDGVLPKALPHRRCLRRVGLPDYELPAGDEADVTSGFRSIKGASPFRNAGYMEGGKVWTRDVTASL